MQTPVSETPAAPISGVASAFRHFAYHAAANGVGVVLAVAPLAAVDTLYVLNGQQPGSILMSWWVSGFAIALGITALFLVNWHTTKGLRRSHRFGAAAALTVGVSLLAAVPSLLFLYWFHFAIGGAE